MAAAPVPTSIDARLEALRTEGQQLQNAADSLKSSPAAPTISTARGQSDQADWWNTHDAMTISSVILVFGAVVVAIAAYLIRKETDGQIILKVLATILIITFSVFLIVAGWSDQQIAPAMGLLGTIAGYLLGKDTRPPINPVNKQE